MTAQSGLNRCRCRGECLHICLQPQDMADRGHDGEKRDAEDTDVLLYSDLNDNNSAFGLDSPSLKLDHCDLLLDAIDAQLGQLQVQPQKRQAVSRQLDCSSAAPLRWSQSLSKDTGLGSTTQTNDTPMSCLDLIHTPTMEQTSERSTSCWEAPVTHEETKQKLDRKTKEEMDFHREQVIWRLERLLGDTCNEGSMAGDTHPPSDSICTEDFVRRFKDEMVELTLPDSNMEQLDKEEEAERTKISDCEQKGQSILDVNCKDAGTAHYFQSNEPCLGKELGKCLSGSNGVNTSCSKKAGAGGGCSTPQMPGGDSSIFHRAEDVTEHETPRQNNRCSPKARCLAGVPVWSFDTVSIDSDLDSVCTEQVRKHIHTRPGWHSLIQSVTDMDDYCTNQSDYDTPTQEESEPQSTSGQKSSSANVQNRSPSVRKAQRSKRETSRFASSSVDNDKDTDEEINHWSRRCRPERTSEKMQSDWAKMKERLCTLRQKCEKEEETLQLKRTQLKDAELSLSELQQRRKHALQELERLSVETAKMETERRTVRDSRTWKDSISCQVPELQKQREPCILEIRDVEEDLATLSRCKQTVKDGAFTPGVIMSALEREEMDRQLDGAKTELFAEQRRARERLESMQEKLEETRDELQRVTDSESLLRSRCVCLEEKQRQKKDQMEAIEFQVGKLQDELGEYKIRVGTLEKMLAQKELQLLDLQETRATLQAERDGLRGELQHLKTQHCSALKEAQKQAKRMEAALKQQKKDLTLTHEQKIQKVNKQAEEEKTNALKEQALCLTQHIESLKSSIQLKEEEARKLRDSLEQQKEEAKQREEELRAEASEKVHKAIEEERRKSEAQKVKAVQVHCGILEEQNRKSLESMRSETQREKNKATALQHKVVELQTRVQELESESSAQQREHDSLLAVICKSLKEEHQAELQKLQRQMAQESQRAAMRLERTAQLAEGEAGRLQVMLEERESSHNQITAELDQQLRQWAHELGAECQHHGAKQSRVQLPPSLTAAETLANLRTLREQLMHLISHLQQELDSQKQTIDQLRKDKERELSIQRQQLRTERDQALDSLKERLIQEHIEELSSLNWAHMCDGGAEGGGGGGGVAASLRKQLKAKDLQLRQVQRSMGQWKEQTAARLACKFEEELTAELERKTSKTQEPGRTEGEMMLSAKEAQNSVCSPSLLVAASHSPSDVASFKLLRYLQSKVKQLRVENQGNTWNPSNTAHLDLSGSYLTTMTQDTAGIQSHSSVSTVSS
ncbi:trichohyalin isoform X3 [Larimichthys crocea]|uniref:trichohyalin isoform X3 n=1 Tax=Larimichthys crocea TaxID=215358 RepID=UPI000F5F38C6|nr:trichohyalin isoform X3 [Larimichthys crocea]